MDIGFIRRYGGCPCILLGDQLYVVDGPGNICVTIVPY